MNKKIQTYNDLLEERQRLETLLAIQKQQVKNSFSNVTSEFSSVKRIFGHVKHFIKGNSSNPAINLGVKFASDAFLRRVLLARAGWVTKFVVPLLFRNYSSNFLNSEKNKKIFSKVKALFKRGKPGREERGEEEFYRGYGGNAMQDPSTPGPINTTPESRQY